MPNAGGNSRLSCRLSSGGRGGVGAEGSWRNMSRAAAERATTFRVAWLSTLLPTAIIKCVTWQRRAAGYRTRALHRSTITVLFLCRPNRLTWIYGFDSTEGAIEILAVGRAKWLISILAKFLTMYLRWYAFNFFFHKFSSRSLSLILCVKWYMYVMNNNHLIYHLDNSSNNSNLKYKSLFGDLVCRSWTTEFKKNKFQPVQITQLNWRFTCYLINLKLSYLWLTGGLIKNS